MAVSYNGLWKLLIDKNMKKVDLMNRIEISSSTMAKMTKEELVSLKVLEKICAELDCDFGDIIHYRQESVSRPKQVKWLVDEIENAIDDLDFDAASATLEKLKAVLGEDNSEYKKMDGMISDAKLIEGI